VQKTRLFSAPFRGVAQLVARLLWEQDAAGSNPVTPTKTFEIYGFQRFFIFSAQSLLYMVCYTKLLILKSPDVGRHMMFYEKELYRFTEEAKTILGDNLTGVYLHGSLAMGCFHPAKSDIDLILVVVRYLSFQEKSQLMEAIFRLQKSGPAKGVEISIVRKDVCSPFLYPTPFELHFSITHETRYLQSPKEYIETMHGVDKDLAAHFTILEHYGIVLYGEDIAKVFAPVPPRDYLDSIYGDIQQADKDILENPLYVTLNLCRVLAFLEDGAILSKKDGGEWGISHLSKKYHPLLSQALQCYSSREELTAPKEILLDFGQEVLSLIQAKKETP
jgi:hypothetical protein